MQISIKHHLSFNAHSEPIYSLCQIDNHNFLSGGGDCKLIKWNISDDKTATLIAKLDASIYTITKYLDHQFLIGTNKGHIYLIDELNKTLIISINVHKSVFCAQIDSENKVAYFGLADGNIIAINMQDGSIINQVKVAHNHIRSLNICNQILWASASDGFIYKLNKNLMTLFKIKAHNDSVFTILSHNNILTSGGKDAMLNSWESSSNELKSINSIPAHLFTINDMILIENQQLIVTASRDKSIKIWQHPSLLIQKVLDRSKHQKMHSHSVNKLIWFDEHQILISASDDRSIQSWNLYFE